MRKLTIFVAALSVFASIPVRAQPPERVAPPRPVNGEPFFPIVTWPEVEKQIGGATLVSLDAHEMPALQVFAALDAQTPFHVGPLNASDWQKRAPGDLNAAYRAQPFWWVARDVARKLHGRLHGDGSNAGLSFLYNEREKSGVDAYSDSTMFTITDASYRRVIALGAAESPDKNATGRDWLTLNGKIYLDPKLSVLNGSTAFHFDEAIDENGQSLLRKPDVEVTTGGTLIDFHVLLNPPARRGGMLKRLRGQFHCLVPFGWLRWEVPDALKVGAVEKIFPQPNGADAVRVELQPVKKDDDNYFLSLFISQNGALPAWRGRLSTGQNIWVGGALYSGLQIIDDKSMSFNRVEVDMKVDGDEQTSITNFNATFRPQNSAQEQNARLVLDYRFDWRELIVPFEFENIALP